MATVALLPLTAVVLAGCSTTPRWDDDERTTRDEIPDANSEILQSVDAEGSRYFGEVDGVDFYGAPSLDNDQTLCLVLVEDSALLVSACGADAQAGQMTGSGFTALYSTEPLAELNDGWIAVTTSCTCARPGGDVAACDLRPKGASVR